MLNGRDRDAIDIADGSVAQLQTSEDAELDIIFSDIRMVLSDTCEPVTVDDVEGAFHLSPLTWCKAVIASRLSWLAVQASNAAHIKVNIRNCLFIPMLVVLV